MSALSLQKERLFFKRVGNEIQMLWKLTYTRKHGYRITCVCTDTCTGTETTWEVPKLILVFRALSRRTGWKQLSTNLSCHLDKRGWVKRH